MGGRRRRQWLEKELIRAKQRRADGRAEIMLAEQSRCDGGAENDGGERGEGLAENDGGERGDDGAEETMAEQRRPLYARDLTQSPNSARNQGSSSSDIAFLEANRVEDEYGDSRYEIRYVEIQVRDEDMEIGSSLHEAEVSSDEIGGHRGVDSMFPMSSSDIGHGTALRRDDQGIRDMDEDWLHDLGTSRHDQAPQ
ncbi:hypothetical protein Sjap_010890 [Stephania japonica]|uniref:Uncharacterized protein n=1 Tax=Stephania japonica TaxID=461633 RepID=A0AAP0P4K1_9MAGN